MKKRESQHDDETAIEYMRRVVSAMNHEYESILDYLPSVSAVLDYFDLMHSYNTEFFSGITEAIGCGEDSTRARKFFKKYKFPASFIESIDYAVEHHKRNSEHCRQ